MNLDIIGSIACGVIALCLFGLHVVSSPSKKRWMDLPEYVRHGIAVTGLLFMMRSVNLTHLASDTNAVGRMNMEGLATILAVCYLVCALTWWVASRHLPDKFWDRIRFVEKSGHDNPDLVPVMMPLDQVVKTSTLTGVPAVPPAAPAEELVDALKSAPTRSA